MYLTKKKRLVCTTVIFLMMGGAVYGISQWGIGVQWVRASFDDPIVRFFYHPALSPTASPEEEVERGKTITLFRATEGKLTGTPLVVSLRREQGLRIVTSLTRVDIISNLLRNAERAFPERYPDYKKLSERTFDYADKKAAETVFTYISPAGEKIKQRFMIISYDPDTVLYLTAQAKESDFAKLDKKYFTRMFTSFQFE